MGGSGGVDGSSMYPSLSSPQQQAYAAYPLYQQQQQQHQQPPSPQAAYGVGYAGTPQAGSQSQPSWAAAPPWKTVNWGAPPAVDAADQLPWKTNPLARETAEDPARPVASDAAPGTPPPAPLSASSNVLE